MVRTVECPKNEEKRRQTQDKDKRKEKKENIK